MLSTATGTCIQTSAARHARAHTNTKRACTISVAQTRALDTPGDPLRPHGVSSNGGVIHQRSRQVHVVVAFLCFLAVCVGGNNGGTLNPRICCG